MPKPVSPDLLAFKAQLDSHRQAHPRRSRIPAHLWHMAVALLARHSISAVCRATNLHQQGLRRHAVMAGVISASSSAAPKFIQLDAPDLKQLTTASTQPTLPPTVSLNPESTPPYRLSVERADGSRLTIQLPAFDWGRIEALCSLFLRA